MRQGIAVAVASLARNDPVTLRTVPSPPYLAPLTLTFHQARQRLRDRWTAASQQA